MPGVCSTKVRRSIIWNDRPYFMVLVGEESHTRIFPA